MADLLPSLSQAFDHAAQVVRGVRPEDLDKPTPCRDWDVRTLVSHFAGVVVNMGRGAAGEALLPPDRAFVVGDDLADRFRADADRTLAAWRAQGLEGEVDVGAGPMPATVAAGVNLLDTATHTWDLAKATGQPAELPDDLAATVLEAAHGITSPELREVVGIDPPLPVADDASPTAKLVAYMGRRP
jgi:uncharacterized protein (TIGR03086 family)